MRILNSLKDIDIIDVNYSAYNFRSISENNTIKKRIRKLFAFLLFFVNQIINDLRGFFIKKNINNKNVFFYNTVNQYNSLLPIHEIIEDPIFLSISNNKDKRLPMTLGYLISLLLLPRFFMLLSYKYKNDKKFIKKNCLDFFYIEGMFIWWSLYFRRNRPKKIIISNDHSPWHRILIKVAKHYNIPTIYIQHASVTDKFPKLDFDLSLLEGKDSLNKYADKGLFGKVALVGMPKFDNYFSKINKNNDIQSIGICTSLQDSESNIENLCKALKKSFGSLNIILRKHPRDSRHKFYHRMMKVYSVKLSNSVKENSFEYLTKVDVNIAGETSIHLESVLMNVYPVYFNLKNVKNDYYGYIKNNLITDVFDNATDLVSFLKSMRNNKKNIRFRAKYFVDTVNTEFDGESTILAKNIISELQ